MYNYEPSLFDYLSGPTCLGIQLLLVFLTIAGVRTLIRGTGTFRPGKQALPDSPEPYAIASLRGSDAVIMLAIMRLIARGALQANARGSMIRATGKVPAGLHSFETDVLRFFATQRLSRYALNAAPLRKLVLRYFGHHRTEQARDGLLNRVSPIGSILIRSLGMALILGASVVLLRNADNIQPGLAILMFFVCGAGMATTYALPRPSLNRAGRRRLKALKTAFGQFPEDRSGEDYLDRVSLAAAAGDFQMGEQEEWSFVERIYAHRRFFTQYSTNGLGKYFMMGGVGYSSCHDPWPSR